MSAWPGHYNKAIASAILSVLELLGLIFGVNFPGISEQWIIALLTVLSTLLVWAVPNRAPPPA